MSRSSAQRRWNSLRPWTSARERLGVPQPPEGQGDWSDYIDDALLARMVELVDDPDQGLRWDLAGCLSSPFYGHHVTDLRPAVDALVRLTGDPAARVRDMATFSLGQQGAGYVDGPGIRDALARRLTDPDLDTRCEAVVGLALRGDERAYPHLRRVLSRPSGNVWRLEVEAAAALGDPRLHDLVVKAVDGWDELGPLAAVAERMTRPDAPGEDLIDALAARTRAGRLWGARLEEDTWWDELLGIDVEDGRLRVLGRVCDRLADDPDLVFRVCTDSWLAMQVTSLLDRPVWID